MEDGQDGVPGPPALLNAAKERKLEIASARTPIRCAMVKIALEKRKRLSNVKQESAD